MQPSLMITKDEGISTQKIAELRNSLSSAREDHDRVEVLVQLARELASKNPKEAKNYASLARKLSERLDYLSGIAQSYSVEGTIFWHLGDGESVLTSHLKALEIYRVLKDKIGIGRSYTGIGNLYSRNGDNQKAIEYYHKALASYKDINFQEGLGGCYNNLGIVFKNIGDYEKALEYYLKAFRIKELLGDAPSIANSYGNVGLVFYYLKNFTKALEYHKAALEIFQKNADKSGMAATNINIGIVYLEQGHFNKALRYLNASKDVLTEINDISGLASSNMQIGNLYIQLDNLEDSLASFEKALSQCKEMGNDSGTLYCYNRIGEINLKKGKLKEALDYLYKAENINRHVGNKKDLLETYLILSKTYIELEDYKKAFECQSKYIDIKDEIFNEEKSRTISEMQAKYEIEKKDLEIDKLNIEQKFLKRTNEELEQFASKAAHDLKEPLRMMSNFSGLLLKRYGDRLDESGNEFLEIIQDAAKRMNGLLVSMLEYARTGTQSDEIKAVDLNDVMLLVKSNLQLALEEKSGSIQFNNLPMVKATMNTMIQLFQNLISNSLKFNTKENPLIEIDVKEKAHTYLISVKDNGIGIPEDQQKYVFELFHRANSKEKYDGSGIGLATCKRIVENLGGEISIQSTVGEGTTISFTLLKP